MSAYQYASKMHVLLFDFSDHNEVDEAKINSAFVQQISSFSYDMIVSFHTSYEVYMHLKQLSNITEQYFILFPTTTRYYGELVLLNKKHFSNAVNRVFRLANTFENNCLQEILTDKLLIATVSIDKLGTFSNKEMVQSLQTEIVTEIQHLNNMINKHEILIIKNKEGSMYIPNYIQTFTSDTLQIYQYIHPNSQQIGHVLTCNLMT
jgi:hypothetical protein